MTDIVLNWLGEQGLLAKTEFPTPWGICDIVGASLNKNRVRLREKNGQLKPIGPISRIALFFEIPDAKTNSSITKKKLERKFEDFFTPLEIHKELEYLTKNHYIHSPRKNHFQSLNGWLPLHKRLVTIELKLNKIEEALFQAASHLKFTAESYVAYPIEIALRIADCNRLNRFKDIGIGIIGVDVDSCKVVLKSNPRKDIINPVFQTYFIERFWREYITNS